MSTVAVPGAQTLVDQDRAAQMVSVGDDGWDVGGTRCGPGAPDLADALYERWFTLPATPAPAAPHDPPLHHRSLLGPLRAAHEGAARVTNGWVVTEVSPAGGVAVAHGDRRRWAASGEYVTQTQPGCPPAPGQPVSMLDRLDHLDVERGLWWTFSDGALREPIGRVYVNTRAAAVPRLLREITSALVDFTFCLKCSVHPHTYRRVDAMVISTSGGRCV